MLHLVFGVSGSGKSTISRYLSEKLNAEIINTDILHSLLFPDGERTETGDFTPDQLKEIYRSLRPLAFYLSKISPDKHFIFEGNFRYKQQRDFVTEVLEENKLPFSLIYVELKDEDKAKQRIDYRHENEGAPDTFEDYLKIKEYYEFPSEDEAYFIDNSGEIEELHQLLDNYLENLDKKV